jgi:hypothetical protein
MDILCQTLQTSALEIILRLHKTQLTQIQLHVKTSENKSLNISLFFKQNYLLYASILFNKLQLWIKVMSIFIA